MEEIKGGLTLEGLEEKKRIRSFVCVELDEATKKRLASWLKGLSERISGLRWVSPEGLHVTLKFCGEMPPDQVERMNLELARLEGHMVSPFELTLAGVGAFPHLRQPRVIWLGIAGEVQALHSLWRQVEMAAKRAGLPPEVRPFHPHLTLARVKNPKDVPLSFLQELSQEDASFGPWTVETLTFMRSTLMPEGANYSPLARYKLGGDE